MPTFKPEASAAEGAAARVFIRDYGSDEFDKVILAGLVEVGVKYRPQPAAPWWNSGGWH
jgi:hypothetical protein